LAPKRKVGRFSPRSLALNDETGRAFRLSCGKLRKEPAIRRFDGSFAPISACDERFARQHRCGPPPEFLPASSDADIVHRLSGTDGLARDSEADAPARPGAAGEYRLGPTVRSPGAGRVRPDPSRPRGTSRRRGGAGTPRGGPPSPFSLSLRASNFRLRRARGGPSVREEGSKTLARPSDFLVRVTRRVETDPPEGGGEPRRVPTGGDPKIGSARRPPSPSPRGRGRNPGAIPPGGGGRRRGVPRVLVVPRSVDRSDPRGDRRRRLRYGDLRGDRGEIPRRGREAGSGIPLRGRSAARGGGPGGEGRGRSPSLAGSPRASLGAEAGGGGSRFDSLSTISGRSNPLSRVLCSFPSRYLWRIGLSLLSSLG